VYNTGPGTCPNEGCTGCWLGWIWPVCSKPRGSTAHGLCDMVGNLSEWVEDDNHPGQSYDGAPTDGSAWVTDPRVPYPRHVGGGYDVQANYLTFVGGGGGATGPDIKSPGIGFRPARSVP